MIDYSDLVKRLRGKKLNCTCAAKSASECCCDTDWPESSCDEAADAIEALEKRIEELKAALKPFVMSSCFEMTNGQTKFKAIAVSEKDLIVANRALGEKE